VTTIVVDVVIVVSSVAAFRAFCSLLDKVKPKELQVRQNKTRSSLERNSFDGTGKRIMTETTTVIQEVK
jgi:hypothetical protein